MSGTRIYILWVSLWDARAELYPNYPKRTREYLRLTAETGTEQTLRIYSITSISVALLIRLVGDIMEFQDHDIPEK